MSLTPWGIFGADVCPYTGDIYQPVLFEPMDPFTTFAKLNRPLRRMERRLEREMGKMVSGIHEDDKTFQVCNFIALSCSRFLDH
jgi:hypothetical protein